MTALRYAMCPRLVFPAAIVLGLLLLSPLGRSQEPAPDDSVTVSFVSEPTGAQVSVDGKKSCVAPCKAVLFRGSHVIGMGLFGYFAHEELMDIQKDRKISWKLEVEKGGLSVSSEPDGVSIVIRPTKVFTQTAHSARSRPPHPSALTTPFSASPQAVLRFPTPPTTLSVMRI